MEFSDPHSSSIDALVDVDRPKRQGVPSCFSREFLGLRTAI